MECLSKSLRIVLLLFSFFIEVQATRTMLSPTPCPLSLESVPCLPDQKSDLLQFLHALISDNSSSVFCQLDIGWLGRSKMLSWIANSGCCLWDGVTCDPMTGHVTRLELGCLPPNPTCYSSVGSSNSSEPSTLGLLNLPSPQEAERPSRSNELLQNLTKLRVLALDRLNQSGIDVTRLSNLPPSLEVLNLCLCKLHGALAENIFHLPKLTCLNLFGNKELSGYLPESTLKNSLKILDLSSSRFFGKVPESIGDLHSLQILWLNRCSFTGSIPSSHGNLTWLTHLEPSYNEFSGQVPPTLSNLDQLSLLDLSLKNFIRMPNVFDNKTQLLLDFSHSLFKGPIPPSTKNLSNLALLDISNNLIGGFIPSSLFSLPSLTSLNLSNNGLSGHIGEFFATSALDHVELSSNQLRGPVPSSILQLRNLTYLSISANNLTGVLDLQVLSRLKSLTNLDLSDNILSLSKSENTEHVLPSLLSVSLSGCLVTEIPAFLRNSTSIEWIYLFRNRMHGDIPSWVWDIGAMSLSYLNLPHNFLASFEKVHRRNFIILDLHWNMIQGPVPPPSLPHSIIVFSLASNRLTGFIPGSICEIRGLQVLDLSHNNFTATIPQSLKNVSNSLLVLDMQENGLSGTISLTFNKDAALRSLHLNGNQFEGPLPCSLINREQLVVLDLGNNKLNYTFPKLMGTLPSLQVLVLQSNGLCGPIGSIGAEFSFSRLRILDLSVDDFMGPLPGAFFANLKAMITTDQERSKWRHMDQGYYQDSMIATAKGCDMLIPRILAILMTTDLSSDKFQVKFPDAIGELRLLKGLNLSHNNVEGHIPLPLRKLSELEWLDLSSNELIRTIQTMLTNPTSLEVLNVSSNQLRESIPHGHKFNKFQAESYHGNLGLCGFPLCKACTDSRAPRKLTVFPEGRVHSFLMDFFDPGAVEIGLGCGILLRLIMSILKILVSVWQTNRNFRQIATLKTISKDVTVRDPKMNKVSPPFLYGTEFGSGKKTGKMAFGEGRSLAVKCLAVLFLLGRMSVFASASFTLVYYNNCPIPIFPSLIPTGSSMKIENSTSLSAINPSKVQNYTLPDGWAGFGFFSTGCTLDGLAALNCTTGNCKSRDCTAEDSPVATAYIVSNDGNITMSAERGYNLGLEIMPMCVGCTSASCKAQLESCPNDLRLLNSSGAVVGCKPGRGLYFSENQCAIPGDYSISTARITCPLKNCITKITVSCQH